MSYTSATFFLDYEGGSDTTRTALTTVTVSNPSGSITRCNKTGHALVTGAVVDLTLFSSWLNEAWKITVVDADNFDLDGAVWQATADASGTATPRGGMNKADAWKTITSGATSARLANATSPPNTVRVMGSPAATSLGQNGTWTEAGPNNSAYALVSSTNATPIVVTLSSGNYTLLAPAVDDTVIINGHTTNTNANGVWRISAVNGSTTFTIVNEDSTNSVGNGAGGATGTVRKINNSVVRLASAVTKAVALLGNQGTKTNWTASANVTATVITSDFKEGGECQQLAVASGFTTGLAAYLTIGVNTDFSAYQQVTFWIKQTSGTVVVAGDLSLRLCTDTIGVVSANTIAVPALGALNRWMPVTVDTAAALTALGNSVALYVDTDRGAQTFLLDCIVAAKASSSADSLSLTSLISKNTGNEAWWGVQSINSTRVMLDGGTNDFPGLSPQRGYTGTSESVTTYKRETIKTGAGTSPTAATQTTQAAHDFQGGWDRTNMTTQDLITFFDGMNGYNTGLNCSGDYASIDKLAFSRYQTGLLSNPAASTGAIVTLRAGNCGSGLQVTGKGSRTVTTLISCANTSLGVSYTVDNQGMVITTAIINSNGSSGAQYSGNTSNTAFSRNNKITTLTANNNGSYGVEFAARSHGNAISAMTSKYNASAAASFTGDSSSHNRIGSLTATNNGSYAVVADNTPGYNLIGGGSSANNGTAAVYLGGVGFSPNPGDGLLVLRNFTVSEGTVVASVDSLAFYNRRAAFENFGGTVGDHRIYTDGGTIRQQTGTVHGSDVYGWQYSPTSANRAASYPLDQVVARVAVAASALVTVSRWFRRTNTGLSMRLVCKGRQIAGVDDDVVDTITEVADTWEQLTITFTPTEKGVVEITEEAYGGTTYSGYTSDWSISQA